MVNLFTKRPPAMSIRQLMKGFVNIPLLNYLLLQLVIHFLT